MKEWSTAVLVLCLLLSFGARAEEEAPPTPAAAEKPAAEAPEQAEEIEGGDAPKATGRPVLHILSPEGGAAVKTPSVLVQVEVDAPPGEPVTLHARIDGRDIGHFRGVVRAKGNEKARSLHLPVPPRDCTVEIIGKSATATSEPVLLRLRWDGVKEEAPASKPRLYVLSVGVSEYRDVALKLRYPAKDASDLAAALTEQAGRLYRAVETRVLSDREATRTNILDGLSWLERQSGEQDVSILFLGGHGVNDPRSGAYSFLPHDGDTGALGETGLPGAQLQAALRRIRGRVILFLDSCHAGNVLGASLGVDLGGFAQQLLSDGGGLVVLAAATGRQPAAEAPEWGNGVFTKAVVEGLRGAADYRKSRRVTLNMLELYVSERVKDLTHGAQTPTSAKLSTLADFPLALIDAEVQREPGAPAITRAVAPRATMGLDVFSAGVSFATPLSSRPGASWQIYPQLGFLVQVATPRFASLGVRLGVGPVLSLEEETFGLPSGAILERSRSALFGGQLDAALSLRFRRDRVLQPAVELGIRVGGARYEAPDGDRSLLLLSFPLRGRLSLRSGRQGVALDLGLSVDWFPDTTYQYSGAGAKFAAEGRRFGLSAMLGISYEYKTAL